MTYKGIVKGNVIIIDPPAALDDGTEVEIIPVSGKDPVCGSWDDERTADDIIREIRASRNSRDKSVSL